ncbi:TrmH family RNA methyltransferase [Spirochaeta dissipatitropha]
MSDEKLIKYLQGFISPERLQRIENVLPFRTRYLCVVLEDIFQPHNASAVLRSCDACGVQDVHIIENRNSHRTTSGIELGTAQWLSRHRYRETDNNTMTAIKSLRSRGYRIVATSPHAEDVTPADFDIEKGPAALLFGTELNGLSELAMREADEFIRIPMHGFVESYNISVSVAIILNRLIERLHNSSVQWQLDEKEITDLRLQYVRNSIRQVKKIEDRYHKDIMQQGEE